MPTHVKDYHGSRYMTSFYVIVLDINAVSIFIIILRVNENADTCIYLYVSIRKHSTNISYKNQF